LKCGFTAPNCNFEKSGDVAASSLTDSSSGKICNKYFAALNQGDQFCCQYQVQTPFPTGTDSLKTIMTIDQIFKELDDNKDAVGPDYLIAILDKIQAIDMSKLV
jgi:hypothetical protein